MASLPYPPSFRSCRLIAEKGHAEGMLDFSRKHVWNLPLNVQSHMEFTTLVKCRLTSAPRGSGTLVAVANLGRKNYRASRNTIHVSRSARTSRLHFRHGRFYLENP